MNILLFLLGCDQRVYLDNNIIYPSTFIAQGTDNDEDGWLVEEGDCNDNNPQTYPGAPEICDGEDNDCDRILDESDPDLIQSTLIQQFRDRDGDGYGQTILSAKSCFVRAGYATEPDDCNDEAPLIHPQAPEICDSIDNDCDLLIDQDDPNLVPTRWFEDKDEDSSGSNINFVDIDDCSSPLGFVIEPGDCNDENPEIHGLDIDEDGASICEDDCDDLDSLLSPNANEYCDGIDNNCDGKIDNKDPLVYGAYWYKDRDGDGFGNLTDIYLHANCTQPLGWVDNRDDCSDQESSIYPTQNEICNNGIDDNCDGAIDCADSTCIDTIDCPIKIIEVCAEEADTKLVVQNTSDILPAALLGQERILYALDNTIFDQDGFSWQSPQTIIAFSSVRDVDGDSLPDAIAFASEQSFLFSSQNSLLSPTQTMNMTGSHAILCAENILIIDENSIKVVGGDTYTFSDISSSVMCIDHNQDALEELWFSIPSQGLIQSLNPLNGTITLERTIPTSQVVLLANLGDINEDNIQDFLLLHDQKPITIVTNTEDETTDVFISHFYSNPWNAITSTDTDQDGLLDAVLSTTSIDNRGEVIYMNGKDVQQALTTPASLEDIGVFIHTPMVDSLFGDTIFATSNRLLVTAPKYHIQEEQHGAIYEYNFPLVTDYLSFPDEDKDGFGALSPPTGTCVVSSTAYQGDCQDNRSFSSPHMPEDCTNNIDDDCDGYIDDHDRDCQVDFQENCIDMKDNDEDNLIDCLDPDCMGTLSCEPATLISSGTIQRTLYPSPNPDCTDLLCTDYPQGYCALNIEIQGDVRIPIEAQNYERCSFELLLEYKSDVADCSVLENTQNIFSSSCLENISSIPTVLTANEFGDANHFSGYDFLKVYSVTEKFEDGTYIWTGNVLPQPTK